MRKRETSSFSPLESREVHERRGRCMSFGDTSSSDDVKASPVVPTDPPQAEGDMTSGGMHLFLSSGESRVMRAERPL
jgi:hypothetical protein